MRTLIAISSCQSFEDSGLNDPIRHTWGADAKKLGMDVVFFHGQGSTPKEDVVVVNVVDEMYGLTEKLKAKCKWSVEHGYDAVFSCFPDTYASAQRLLDSYKVPQDYLGNVYQFSGSEPFCQGGPGYFLSRRACEILSKDQTSYLNDDCWASDVLSKHGIHPIHDARFTAFGPGPLKSNDSVTVHLSTQPCGYTGENLLQAHRDWLKSCGHS